MGIQPPATELRSHSRMQALSERRCRMVCIAVPEVEPTQQNAIGQLLTLGSK